MDGVGITDAPVKKARAKPNLKPAGSLHPFKRAAILFQQIMAIKQEWNGANTLEIQRRLGELPEYRSRGHGKPRSLSSQRSCFSRSLQDRSKYNPAIEEMRHFHLPRRERERRALLATGIKVNQNERDDVEAVV